MELLLGAPGVDVNAKNDKGETALYGAAKVREKLY